MEHGELVVVQENKAIDEQKGRDELAEKNSEWKQWQRETRKKHRDHMKLMGPVFKDRLEKNKAARSADKKGKQDEYDIKYKKWGEDDAEKTRARFQV